MDKKGEITHHDLRKAAAKKVQNQNGGNQLTTGQKAADWITRWAGSWTFIISFGIFLILWMIVNVSWLIFGRIWDPYPFILLNLVLSCLAAVQAPIILMSQNRQMERDRARAEYDYAVNRKAEKEITDIQKQLNRIEKVMMKRHLKK
jgi:uncharacterized membrane protein